jgi:hypothetical protein
VKSAGLCIPHFLHALALTRENGARRWLVSTQREKYASLQRELDEFVGRCDYRRSGEGFGAEGDSWIRAMKMFAGETGIF